MPPVAPEPPPAAPTPSHASPWRNPWWIPPFLGGVPPVEPRLMRVLGLVTLGMAFEQYDLSLINSAIKHINEELHISLADSAYYLSAIRGGGFLTFLIVPFADRVGRRRIFLAALVGMSVGTLASGLAQTGVQFVAAQIVTRAFLLTAVAVAVVILTEEFPAEHRGWAIGMLGAVGGIGYGLGALLFALIDVLPYGWRALYAFGFVPVLVLPLFRRELGETARFTAHRDGLGQDFARGLRGWSQPVFDLVRSDPRRFAGVALGAAFAALGGIAVFQYTSLFVQTVHHWAPWQYSALIFCGGMIGIVGNVAAGRLSDRFGRRRVGCCFLGLFPVFAGLFYLGPSWSAWIAFGLFVFCNSGGEVILRAFATELFATSHRGTSAGMLIFMQTLGWSIGLFMVGAGTEEIADLVRMICGLSLAVALGGLALLSLPETGRRELEEISGAV